MKKLLLSILVLGLMISLPTVAQERTAGKNVQKVDFSETDINGKVRSPDGSYLVQKKGIDFDPLYKVKKKLNDNVKESLEYVH
ncbi:MAG: hypothetical protein SGJ18_05930 [Pseudomonadota bacterium]|nr:hypothetical protein [Pseudomonadota bacterium]